MILNENIERKGDIYPSKIVDYKKAMLLHKDDPSNLTDDESFSKYYHRYWKRNQISDHLPIWIEIEEDSSPDFLANKL